MPNSRPSTRLQINFRPSRGQLALLAFLLLTLVGFVPFCEDFIPERRYDDYHELYESGVWYYHFFFQVYLILAWWVRVKFPPLGFVLLPVIPLWMMNSIAFGNFAGFLTPFHVVHASSLLEAAVICVFLYRVPKDKLA